MTGFWKQFHFSFHYLSYLDTLPLSGLRPIAFNAVPAVMLAAIIVKWFGWNSKRYVFISYVVMLEALNSLITNDIFKTARNTNYLHRP